MIGNASALEITWTLAALVCAWQTAVTWLRTIRRVRVFARDSAANEAGLLILRADRRTALFSFGLSVAFAVIGLAAMSNPPPAGRGTLNPASVAVAAALLTGEAWLLVVAVRNNRDRNRLLDLLQRQQPAE